jgi:hypothetical protein
VVAAVRSLRSLNPNLHARGDVSSQNEIQFAPITFMLQCFTLLERM